MNLLRTRIKRFMSPPTSVYVGDYTICARPLHKGYLYLDSRDTSLTPSLALTGDYEPGVARVFKRMVRPGMHVVDIGANIGFYALMAAWRVGPSGSVRALDPNPRMVELLERTFRANAVAGWSRVMEGAVLDRDGEIEFGVPGELLGSASMFVKAKPDRPEPVTTFRARTKPLDAWLGGRLRVDVLKIDAEGAEPLIWQGAREVLAANPKITVFLEFAPAMISETMAPAEFLAQLRADGFRVQMIDISSGRLSTPSDAELLGRDWTELLLTRG